MSAFRDMAAVTIEVDTSLGKVALQGFPFNRIAELIEKYPEVLAVITGKGLDVLALLKKAPNALAEIVAGGVGKYGDPETIADVHAKFNIYDQIDMAQAIVERTLPGGVDPLMKRLARMGLALAGAETAPAPQEPAAETGKPAPKPSRRSKTNSPT